MYGNEHLFLRIVQSMVAWSIDLALKMLYQHPESDILLEEPAVVIIDEMICTYTLNGREN